MLNNSLIKLIEKLVYLKNLKWGKLILDKKYFWRKKENDYRILKVFYSY